MQFRIVYNQRIIGSKVMKWKGRRPIVGLKNLFKVNSSKLIRRSNRFFDCSIRLPLVIKTVCIGRGIGGYCNNDCENVRQTIIIRVTHICYSFHLFYCFPTFNIKVLQYLNLSRLSCVKEGRWICLLERNVQTLSNIKHRKIWKR